MRIGCELTYVPDLPGRDKEFSSEEKALRVAAAFNWHLAPLNEKLKICQIEFIAKADRFRRGEKGEWVGWIIEVTNGTKPTWDFQWRDEGFVKLVQQVFDIAKTLGLLPRIRRRGVHHPSGGGHLVCGIQHLFADDYEYMPKLTLFERNLFLDLANRPYIRWLFAEWFDEQTNHAVSIDLENMENDVSDDYAYNMGLWAGSIRRRFSDDGKPPYAAYEFRMFDAQTCAQDIVRDVKFVVAWVNHHVEAAKKGVQYHFDLTPQSFKRLRNVRYAAGVINKFLGELGLDPYDYRGPFKDNYINRVRYGKMV